MSEIIRRFPKYPRQIPRGVDFATSMKMQGAVNPHKDIYSIRAKTTTSVKIREEYSVPGAGNIKRKTGLILLTPNEMQWKTPSIDDTMSIRELINLASEELPDLMVEGDLTVNSVVSVEEPIDHENFDGVEYILLKEQSNKSYTSKHGYGDVLNSFNYMKGELNYRRIWDDIYMKALRPHSVMRTTGILGDCGGDNIRGYQELFKNDVLAAIEPNLDNVSTQFFNSIINRTDWWRDVGHLRKYYGGGHEVTVLWLNNMRKNLAINFDDK